MTDEKKIIELLKKNDKDAFQTIVDKYHPYVMRICTGFLHNREDAEDITQDVFIDFYQSLMNFRGEAKLSTWLYRVAVNKSLNFIRKNRKSRNNESIESAFKTESTGNENPDLILENIDKAKALKAALNSLPKNQKTAFILNKYNDLSYQEISEVMNKSLSSVESLIHRAKSNLQEKLLSFYKINVK